MRGEGETKGSGRLMPIMPATAEAIEQAAQALRAGRLVAFPTETVYGLGADATNGAAVADIFAAKQRPRFNPLIVHVPDLAAADRLAVLGKIEQKLAEAFWPGGLTLVVKKRPGCPVADLTTSGLDTIAIRVPSHPLATTLLRAVARPVAAPSANRSGHVSPTRAEHVQADLGDRVAIVLDGGPTGIGLESTVVAVMTNGVALLRPGAVTAEAIEQVIGQTLVRSAASSGTPIAPGQLPSHYAPHATVRLNAHQVKPGEALLAFGPQTPAPAGPVVNLSPSGDLREAAANLFSALRTLDATGVATIAVMPIPRNGLGEAINDRLERAAAPRPAEAG
jgi:L-threonylcarbamoyladenylate synthase